MASSAWLSSRFLVLIASVLALSLQAFSQSTTSTASQPATTTSASIYPGTSGFSYYGCWNETTLINGTNGARALNGGVMEDLTTMTAELCIAFCKSNSFTFAGLEYTRECWCSNFVDALSNKLPDSSCNLPCIANSSEICGGNLALTVYQEKSSTSSTKGAGIKGVREASVSSILALGIALAVLLCLA